MDVKFQIRIQISQPFSFVYRVGLTRVESIYYCVCVLPSSPASNHQPPLIISSKMSLRCSLQHAACRRTSGHSRTHNVFDTPIQRKIFFFYHNFCKNGKI